MAKFDEKLLVDWSDCRFVERVPGKLSGVPILKGSRMPADAILQNFRDGLEAEEISEIFQLPSASVRELLTYARSHAEVPHK